MAGMCPFITGDTVNPVLHPFFGLFAFLVAHDVFQKHVGGTELHDAFAPFLFPMHLRDASFDSSVRMTLSFDRSRSRSLVGEVFVFMLCFSHKEWRLVTLIMDKGAS